MEIPATDLNSNQTPKENKFGNVLNLAKIICLIALVIFGISIWRYENHKKTVAKSEIDPSEAWNKFLSNNQHQSNTTDFNISYSDRISKIVNKASNPPIREWTFNLHGKTITDSKNPSIKSSDVSYSLNSGDVGARLDTHIFMVGSDIYFRIADNPFAKLLIQEYDQNNNDWIKVSTSGGSSKIGFSDSDIKQLSDAWSTKNILTPISAEQDKDNPNLTRLSFIFNDKGLKNAIDTTVALYAVEQLKAGKPIPKNDKDSIATGLEAIIQKASIKELTFWIDENQNLIKIKGSLIVPSVIQTIQQLQPASQSSFVSLIDQLILEPDSNNLADNNSSSIGRVLGISTLPSPNSEVTLSEKSENPLDKIVYDAIFNFEYNYSGFNGLQVLSPPKDYFDLTPFLQNIEEDINKQNLKI